MAMPRVQFQLRWLMVLVAVVALILCLPVPMIQLLGIVGGILTVLVLVPAGLAPGGRRVETACWAFILHPWVLLVWLSAWRLTAFRQPLTPKTDSWAHSMILEWPYGTVSLSLFDLPILALIGAPAAAIAGSRLASLKPLVLLPATWLTTLLVLMWDPFVLFVWFHD